MALLVIISFLVWSGVLPVPYDPGFSSAKDDATPVVQSCPASDTTTSDVIAIPVNVYNGSDTTGLASGVADVLSDAGMTVNNSTDWPKGQYDGEIELTTSQAGLTNAYTVAKIFTGDIIVQIDETQETTDTTVSIVLGNDYKNENEMLTAAEIAQIKAGDSITAPTACATVTTNPTAPTGGVNG